MSEKNVLAISKNSVTSESCIAEFYCTYNNIITSSEREQYNRPGLKCVEGGLQSSLILKAGWLLHPPVIPELIQLAPRAWQRVVCRSVLQPRLDN